jgi:hypothetical protein
MAKCLICDLDGVHGATFSDVDTEVECKKCGHFRHTGTFKSLMGHQTKESKARLSGWIWEQNHSGIVPKLTEYNLPAILARPATTFSERAKRLLMYMDEKTEKLGQSFKLHRELHVQAMLEAEDANEVAFVAGHLGSLGLINALSSPEPLWSLTGKGFEKADEWRVSISSGTQGFVAMWFDDSTEEAWQQGLQKGITDAGYRPFRIDMKEHANKICDEIIAEIRRSRFVVADYTGHRGGVYYEAGFAAGRGLPVIPTCRKDEIGKLHFDVRQYNCIDWQTPDELARRLKVRIEAILGDGPRKLDHG